MPEDCHAGGSLAIPGADADAERMAAFVRNQAPHLNQIVATLDLHDLLHIAHASFWISGNSRDVDNNCNDDDNLNDKTTTMKHLRGHTLYNYIGTRYKKGSMATHILDPDDDETLFMVDTTTRMVNLQLYCYHSARRLEAAGRFQILYGRNIVASVV
jgi:hypothetical protein